MPIAARHTPATDPNAFAQMISVAVVKGGSSLKMRFGDVSTRATTDPDVAWSEDVDAFEAAFAKDLAIG